MGIVCKLAHVNKLKVNSLSHRQQAHRPPTISSQAYYTHESKCLLKKQHLHFDWLVYAQDLINLPGNNAFLT